MDYNIILVITTTNIKKNQSLYLIISTKYLFKYYNTVKQILNFLFIVNDLTAIT